ncbi:MAG: mechanosensitive ion channel family protein [Gemmatimonadetes bacterium]|nr:mechanosensitive ion channel family protein [Gemmatimonadota bacterium]
MTWLPPGLTLEHLQAWLTALAPKAVAALLVFVAFLVALRITEPMLGKALRRAQFADGLIRLLVEGLYRGMFLLLGIAMAAAQLGINVSAVLAGLGVVGIALGFAAQETVANMIAGFLIFWDRPFKIGDYITTEEQYGEVKEITLRTTRIRTLDNTYVVIPNKQIIGDTLVNHSMYGETRVVVKIGIAYKERIAEARAVLLEAAKGVDGAMDDPPPDVIARSLGDSSVNLEVRVWIADPAIERPVGARLVEACKVALDKAGIEIPFPHQQLFIENVDDRVWEKAARLLDRKRAE